MSRWAQKRKRRFFIIVGVLVSIVLALIVYQILDKPETCFDGIQNGAETGIDCGGTCQAVCREEVRDIVVWWERPFEVTNGVYNLAAYIENQNLESGIEELQYEFRVYNYDNILISEPIVGSTFIEPNKRSAVFETGITTGDEDAHTVFFRVSSNQNWQRTDQSFAYNLFQIGEPQLTNQDIAPKLQATVNNVSFKNFPEVEVVALLFNQEDNAIASSQTYLDDVLQGEEAVAYFSWPEPFGEEVTRIEIIPRINPFGEY